mmetsp:Transcript_162106/g.519824  ORF Transcript_162106/g.519824 Transcript_162106/m.519824 type:complete len:233 (-) Transcript_162106:373-1071(-)
MLSGVGTITSESVSASATERAPLHLAGSVVAALRLPPLLSSSRPLSPSCKRLLRPHQRLRARGGRPSARGRGPAASRPRPRGILPGTAPGPPWGPPGGGRPSLRPPSGWRRRHGQTSGPGSRAGGPADSARPPRAQHMRLPATPHPRSGGPRRAPRRGRPGGHRPGARAISGGAQGSGGPGPRPQGAPSRLPATGCPTCWASSESWSRRPSEATAPEPHGGATETRPKEPAL